MLSRIYPNKLFNVTRISLNSRASVSACNRFYVTSSSVSAEEPGSSLPRHRVNLVGLLPDEVFQQIASSIPNTQKFTYSQIYNAIYKHGVQSFYQMSSLSKSIQSDLDGQFRIDYGEIKLKNQSVDGTNKFLIHFGNDPRAVIEAVVIPEKHSKKATLCLSSQIGCSLQCKFCHTGTQKLLRNLEASEIVSQFMIAAHEYKDFPVTPTMQRNITNIVFMGQGEPLYNWKNIRKAVMILTDPIGLSFPKSKITISTSGIAPLIPAIASELGVCLAISLHATNNRLRDRLVPINKQYPIEELLASCKQYVKLLERMDNRITFEYVMLDGVNDSLPEAVELARLLRELPAHVNLIPFNPWPGTMFQTSPDDRINDFTKRLMERGVHATVRRPRGRDILAACGQLKSNYLSKVPTTLTKDSSKILKS